LKPIPAGARPKSETFTATFSSVAVKVFCFLGAASARVSEPGLKEVAMPEGIWLWVGFNVFVLAMLALDLGVFHRESHEVSVPEALRWSAVWISLALVFAAGVWHFRGGEDATKFVTGYLIEKALSVDNIFVFIMIFAYFKVPALYQHKVLFWGIIGALVMRAACIAAGITLLKQFHWLVYVFGTFLIFTGIKMVTSHGKTMDIANNPALKFFRRLMPVTDDFHGDKFFIRRDAKLWATPLFVTLLFVEFSDLIFAVDSIPAILAITSDPFLVYTSNVFAILGLRSLYFALAGIMNLFHYLHLGLSAVLVFVGAKMLASEWYKIPAGYSLLIIATILGASVVASLMRPRPPAAAEEADVASGAHG
jgi:tellurite resistance protein TerC